MKAKLPILMLVLFSSLCSGQEVQSIPGLIEHVSQNEFLRSMGCEYSAIDVTEYADNSTKQYSILMQTEEVSVFQFRRFLEESSYIKAKSYDRTDGLEPAECRLEELQWITQVPDGYRIGNLPITGISFSDALMYTKWLSRKSGLEIRLPTAEQWEYCCKSGQAEMDKQSLLSIEYANVGDAVGREAKQGIREVSEGIKDKNGLRNMIGNVSEYVDSWQQHNSIEFGRPSRVFGGVPQVLTKGGHYGVYRLSIGDSSWVNGNLRYRECGFRTIVQIQLPPPSPEKPTSLEK